MADVNLTSATGKSDPNSAWGSGLLSAVTGIATTAITSALGGNKTPVVTPPNNLPQQTNYKPYYLIGGFALGGLLLWFLFRRKGN